MGPGAAPGATVLPRFFRQKIVLALLALSIVYAVVLLVLPNPWIETPLGLLTLFFSPGYALGALVLGSRPRWVWSLTFALVVGLSVAINVGVGIGLLVLKIGLPAIDFAGLSILLLVAAASLAGLPSSTPGSAQFRPFLRREFGFAGHSNSQKAMAWGMIVAIVFLLVVIVYLASVMPNEVADVSFGITGPGGVTSNLPPNGTINETLQIWLVIGNNASSQTLVVVVEALLAGHNGSVFVPVNWTYPIPLSNGTSSAEPVELTPGESFTVHGKFIFAIPGSYVLTFLLKNAQGSTLRQASWSLAIS